MSNPPPVPPYPLPYASPRNAPRRRFGRGLFGWLLFVGLAALLFVWLKQQSPVFATIPFSDFYDQFTGGNVSRIVIDEAEITGSLSTPRIVSGRVVTKFRAYLPSGASGSWQFIQWAMENRHGAVVVAEPSNNILTNFVLPLIPWVLILAFIWFVVFRQLRAARKQPTPVVIVNPEERR